MAWMWSAFLPDFGMLNPRAPFSDDMIPLRRSTVLLATPARTAYTHQRVMHKDDRESIQTHYHKEDYARQSLQRR